MIGRVLVVDDDQSSGRHIQTALATEGLDVGVVGSWPAALERLSTQRPDVVLVDAQHPGTSGLEILEQIRSSDPSTPVVMLTESRDTKAAVRAIQSGAAMYLPKPVDPDELIAVVRRALESRAMRLELAALRQRLNEDEAESLATRLGPSEQIRRVVDQIGTVASSGVTTLIVGEPGTGKDRVARAIHRQSDQRMKPFLALDAGAIPEALLESDLFGHERSVFVSPDRRRSANTLLAEGGTCFLDEVGNLPISLQGRLLRVLEAKHGSTPNPAGPPKADVRFIASTGADLQARVAQGLFRADLYFRLAQYTIVLPPLRERPDDIPFLAQRFVQECAIELRRPVQAIDPAALALLRNHPWKGNVRELRNTMRQAVVQSRDLVIQATDIQAVLSGELQVQHHVAFPHSNGVSLRQAAEQAARSAEREIIVHALQATRGNKSQAAKALKTDYKTLHLKMKALKIRAHDFKNN